MKKIKLTKYQVVLMILFFIIYTITIQISSRSILKSQISDMPADMKMDPQTTLFWLNIVTIIFGLIILIFQSLIYKIIVGFLGTKKHFSIGFNIFIFLAATIPGSIITALLTIMNHNESVSQILWVNILTVLLSSFLYSILLWYYSVIQRKKMIIIFVVISLINIIVNLIKIL